MNQLLKAPESLQGLTIRHQSGFSSFSNPDFQSSDYQEPEQQEERKYQELLVRERDLLTEIIEKGAKIKVILRPPFNPTEYKERFHQRYKKLLEFLRREGDHLNRCEFVIETSRASNLFFFGEEVLFEGFARGASSYESTVKYTNPETINMRIGIFDDLFKSAFEDTIRRFPPEDDSPSGSPIALRQAVIRGIKQAKENLKKLKE